MTQVWRPWLPWEVADRQDVRNAVLGEISAWARDWFSVPPFAEPVWRASRDQMPAPDRPAEWLREGDGVALSLPAAARARLIGLALDLEADRPDLTAADHIVMEAFGRALVGDLLGRLDRRAPGGETAGALTGRGHVEVRLSLGPQGAAFRLYVPFQTVIGLYRALASGPPSRPRHPFVPLTRALGQTAVNLEALLGSVEISLEDLRQLTPGDVLVLDAALDAGVALSVTGGKTRIAGADLFQDAGKTTLVLKS